MKGKKRNKYARMFRREALRNKHKRKRKKINF